MKLEQQRNEGVQFQRVLEMSLTRDEFVRVLPSVVNSFAIDADRVSWSESGCAASIRLLVLPPRRFGSLAVPRLRVELNLAVPEAEGEAFFVRFRRAYLRGGG